MKRVIFLAAATAAALSLSSCATKNAARTGKMPAYASSQAPAANSLPPLPPSAGVSWPLTFNSGTDTYTIFEPQCDSWDGHDLTARSAVGIRRSSQSESTYGEISFKAITLVDKAKGTARLADIKIVSVDFPSASGQTQNYVASLRKEFPEHAQPIQLEHLESSLTLAEQHAESGPLNNAPPKIIIATRPSVLVYIDGPPVWRPVPGTSLTRVLNTDVLMLKDQSGTCYLHVFDGYLQASSLNGRWSVATRPPAGSDAAERLAMDSGQTDLLQGEPDATTQKAPSLSTSVTPDVFVATTPSELITFSGPPQYTPIAGTELLYASNTSADVFKLLTDQQNYILISGRWYRALSLNGPWHFVPGDKLPRDFVNIPDTSGKENVKASIPGTRQAEEALVANSIPQGTAVPRDTRMQDPQIDGKPQLAPIEGTLLHYVVNSSTPILEVNSESWYACENGVWFTSTSLNGAWTVATAVPSVIYTIPTTSPLHYVTYVRVYGSSDDVVYEGYTPGYFGTEVADDGTVVYGTGYDYPGWVGSYWYGGPVTWGWGYCDCWTPWWGWGFDCGFGWGCWVGGYGWFPFFPPFPCWGGFGGFHHHHGHDFVGHGWHPPARWAQGNTSANIYHRVDLSSGTRGQFGRPALTGDYGRAYNSRTGQIAAGESGRVQNVSGAAWSSGRWSGFAGNNRAFGHGGRAGGFYGINRGLQNSHGFHSSGHTYGGGFFHSLGGYFHSGGGGGGHEGGGGGHGGEGGGHGGGDSGGGGGGHGR